MKNLCLFFLGAAELVGCGSSCNRADVSTAPSPTAAATGSERPAAAQPDASAGVIGPAANVADAGPREPSATRILCDDGSQARCWFQGVVRSVGATVLEPSTPDNPRFGKVSAPERALRIVLEDSSSPACAVTQVRGAHLDQSEGPIESSRDPLPRTHELLVTLSSGLKLPFVEGESLCGSVRSFSVGMMLVTFEALVARPSGEVLMAHAFGTPRDASPLPGWIFTPGPQWTMKPPGRDVVNSSEMMVAHGKSSVRTDHSVEYTRLGGLDGEFMVHADGYTTSGDLSSLSRSLGRSGYGFTIVHVRSE